MKKVYTAPEAQVVLFAPSEGIASWNSSGGNWKINGLFWKQENSDIPESPASGKTFWFDFGTDEFK